MAFLRACGRIIRAIWLLAQARPETGRTEPPRSTEDTRVVIVRPGSVEDVLSRHEADLLLMRQILQVKIALEEAGRANKGE